MHDEHDPSHESLPEPLPETLRNWHVLEIDSQATPISAPGLEPDIGDDGDVSVLKIDDRVDDIIVVTLDQRCHQVECGASVQYTLTVLNNGPLVATFHAQIEGWLNPQWAGDGSWSIAIEPGQRATLRLPLSAPRRPESEAGDYHFAITVRSPQYPDRLARLGALLTLLPFDAVELRFLELARPSVSWLGRSATLPILLANRGNHPVPITLHGGNPRREWHFVFGVPVDAAGVAALTLRPNQVVTLPVRVDIQRPPLIGAHAGEVDVQVDVRVHDRPAASTHTTLAARPLIGPWQMVGALGLAAAGAVGMLLVLALVYLLAERSTLPPVESAAAPPAAGAAAAPPVIIVTLNEPAASPAAAGKASDSAANVNSATGPSPDPALPLVLPDQVSAPRGGAYTRAPAAALPNTTSGSPASALPFTAAADPAAGASSYTAGSSNQTYGEMFKDVGARFDLDWRMLAAQAYVESGFDSLALSDAGAMGLMQVLPDTWREWAAAVEVSDPFDAHSSVLVAAVYLDYLRSRLAARGYPEIEWMLVAYNWGPDRLDNFLASGGTWDTLPEARRQYAADILRIAKSIP